ncbi:DUF305 domain-containing protein [Microbacterium esteraromaticum]|uniref:DUF305 domain-containing protein n=1 Tax=Microbacterium esteraromaticum TaxID=57043 RepID=UPI00195EBF99|nr:DUF305 domain-containing protein [Microbacterium esteraromaticum]MBM7466335.1 uncharacterized protein (DUF305 family) [Microbacterium esteraromaticum]
MRIRTLTIGALAVTTVLTLTGCSAPGGEMGGMDHGSSSAPHSADAAAQADVAFAMNMIAHHQQAIEMSDVLLGTQGAAPEVAELAERIKAAQQPEIDTMTQWLTAWGEDPSMGGMDHGDGMMSPDDMAALEDADGPAASRLFLVQMIVHHEGAIEMAEQELADGKDARALELAQRVIDDQTAEIAEMRSMLDAL